MAPLVVADGHGRLGLAHCIHFEAIFAVWDTDSRLLRNVGTRILLSSCRASPRSRTAGDVTTWTHSLSRSSCYRVDLQRVTRFSSLKCPFVPARPSCRRNEVWEYLLVAARHANVAMLSWILLRVWTPIQTSPHLSVCLYVSIRQSSYGGKNVIKRTRISWKFDPYFTLTACSIFRLTLFFCQSIK